MNKLLDDKNKILENELQIIDEHEIINKVLFML